MGSLSNLYISQSYQSLIHFSTDTSASATLTQLEDGVGNDLGVYFNTEGDVKATGDLRINGLATIDYGLTVSGAVLIDTHYSASTPSYTNQNTSIGNTIIVSGSFPSTNNLPTINDVEVGWLVNGAFVTGAVVTSITGKNTGNVTVVINQSSARPSQGYIFTGNFASILSITGSTEQIGDFDLSGSATISNDLSVGGHLIVKNGVEITGSIDITGDVTASNAFIENNLIVSGTINAYKIVTTIESSSIIFSSGSNILGDSILDTQTLNGTIIMSGSSSLTGSMGIIGNFTASGNISSSTLSGVGNVTAYSASVNSRLTNLQLYTASAETKFSAIQTYTSSMNVYTQSVNAKILSLEQFTASVGLVTTQSFQEYTASNNQKWSTLQNVTSSILAFTSSQETKNITLANYTASNDTKWSTLQTYTSSINADLVSIHQTTASLNTFTASQNNLNATFATTGSNTFVGSNVFNKSVNGIVNALSITSNTASMDCLLGNFFTLTLVANTPTRLIPTNIQAGETISLKLTQPATTESLTYNSSTIKFPAGLQYTASALANSIDILTFVTYDASTLFSVAVKNMS